MGILKLTLGLKPRAKPAIKTATTLPSISQNLPTLAIVHDEPGVTRNRISVDIRGIGFTPPDARHGVQAEVKES